MRLRQQGITLIFLKEQLTFSANNPPMQEPQLHMMSPSRQFERALILEKGRLKGSLLKNSAENELADPVMQ
ncbi:recombinase family protein [Photorhabdus bodei]|uniref:recombinase family protein n=1 Tax=Photorhabdus bodei TaxID=2029681 RepID=UPI001EE4A9B6|nr:recombinase family protein [Photorhabdus bodei]